MKQVGILGGLLALSLVGSYLSWTAPDDDGSKATDVVVLRADANAVTSITWSEEGKTIKMTRPSDARGSYIWFETEETEPVKLPLTSEAAVEEQPDPAPAGEPQRMAFAGNDDAVELWDAFAPLYGMRELTIAPDADLEAYGLHEIKTTIEIEMKGRTAKLELGGEAFGTRDRYVRLDGKVYLVDDKTVRPLQFASTRLVERRLFPVAESDMTTVSVTRGGDSRSFVQGNADNRAAAYWADADSPTTTDVEGSTWLGKLFRMRVRAYSADDKVTTPLEPVFSFTVRTKDAEWPVEVLSTQTDKGTEYYARPAYARSLVELTRTLAEEPIADLDTLFDGVTPGEEAEPEDAPSGSEL